ncbi:MAG: hypothetical protein SWJ54_24740 [Cyanobacteriota bacterium]|nr:hypothetical protein [Cyanobacteriota bacterium]
MFHIISAIRALMILVFGLILFSVSSPVFAENSLPQPDEMGDYRSQINHLYWQVVDPDPNGLNCRMGESSIQEVWNIDSPRYPEIGTWSVVTTLQTNEVFKAELTYGGFLATFDQNFNPWIFVEEKSDGTPANCFVRANNNFVQPIAESQFKQALLSS